MVEKLFWQDPYATQLETSVVTVQGNEITLKETIFYAFSGGQERDTGTIAGKTVLDARKEGLEIVYLLNPGHQLNAGDSVVVTINRERRYRLMRLHFAAEIILELVSQNFNGIKKIGAHIAEDKARIDFLWHENLTPYLAELQEAANELIRRNHPITSDFSDAVNQRRYWSIEGFARVPCGGTHLKSTGEVGNIKLRRKNVGKNKERINITLA